MKKQTVKVKKYLTIASFLVFTLTLIGLGITYAYFAVTFRNQDGGAKIPSNEAANMNVTSTVKEAPGINTSQLALIDSEDYLKKAEHVSFTITNNNEATPDGKKASNVNAKYTINIDQLKLSKNLMSKYFKWALIITSKDNVVQKKEGTFEDKRCLEPSSSETCIEEGTKITDDTGEYVLPTEEDMILMDLFELDTKELKIGETDKIDFYIWIENDSNVDQLYLTNGKFQGKLSVSVVPLKTTN